MLLMCIGDREFNLAREVRVEDEEYYGGSFDKGDDQNSIVGNMRYDGWFREVKNQEDNNLGSIDSFSSSRVF